MKKEKTTKRAYSFHSISSPYDFTTRIKDEVLRSKLKLEQRENGFDLQLDSNHGGRIVYRASISADENGGCFIRGEIISVPWNRQPEKKNIFQKIMSVLICIMMVPLVLIFLLGYGIYTLFMQIGRDKNNGPTADETLCNFMINKMCCKQTEGL